MIDKRERRSHQGQNPYRHYKERQHILSPLEKKEFLNLVAERKLIYQY
jgi:hypothetical protein